MKIVRLSDGLGNQLFQYAFARALAKRTGDAVLLDRSWFEEFGGRHRLAVSRSFGLRYFRTALPYAEPDEVNATVYGRGSLGVLRRVLRRRKGLLREGEARLSFERLADMKEDVVIQGWFQQACYPGLVREELLNELLLKPRVFEKRNDCIAEEMAGCASVAVHIRRGDYTTPHSMQVHGLCPPEYYAKALEIVAERTGEPLQLYVFSDDPAWVKENFRSRFPFRLVDFNSLGACHFDIRLMSCCRYAVIANSTFSWWGAWLNARPDKIVVAPERWFADGRRTPGLFPEGWILL
ncbi:MAG: alpha-1,2-fucosyltransferase [Akkermansiaceae bacterium]|nr:alpha-1,2-fucosyltransferase [Akkermansiaceae bacterium]